MYLAVNIIVRSYGERQRIQLASTFVARKALFMIRIIFDGNFFRLVDSATASIKRIEFDDLGENLFYKFYSFG